MDTHENRALRRTEVDSLLRRLLAIDVEPDKALIDEEIVRRRLALI